MKKTIVYWCFLLILGFSQAALASNKTKQEWIPAQLSQSMQTDLYSKNTGRSYRVFLSVPSLPPPEGGYPVVYVLDGNALFPLLAVEARSADRQAARTNSEPVVVVGIGYSIDGLYDVEARTEDYTLHKAEHFLSFIQQELKPIIESNYSINPNKQTLFGHSYGGLFTLYALFNSPSSFQNYIAASPSIWWNERDLLTLLPEFEKKLQDFPQQINLLLGVGALEQPQGKIISERDKHLEKRGMISNLEALYSSLQLLEKYGLATQRYIAPDADHGTSAKLIGLKVLKFSTQ